MGRAWASCMSPSGQAVAPLPHLQARLVLACPHPCWLLPEEGNAKVRLLLAAVILGKQSANLFFVERRTR